jgi:hypothetical protein
METIMADSSSFPPGVDPDAIGRQLLQQAHLRDGLAEIWMGAFFLLSSASIYARLTLPGETTCSRLAALAPLLLGLFLFSSKWVLKRVRRRYLIERWGYVEHKLIDRKRIGFGFLIAAVMALALHGLVPQLSQPDFWRLAGTGLLGGALLAWVGRLPRFVVEGAVMATTGVLVAFSRVPLEVGFAVVFGVQGLITLVAGGVVLLRFLRQPLEPSESQ